MRHLSERFEFVAAYGERDVECEAARADLVLDFWWRTRLNTRFPRVITQVSSHRWRQHKYGKLYPATLVRKFLAASALVVVPSLRLLSILRDGAEGLGRQFDLALTPKGFHSETFGDFDRRQSGDLAIGWAGAGRQPDKRLSVILEACSEVGIAPRLADQCLTQDEMPDFYNAVDVITCASDAEGDPRPLIEGMACGCFPVVVDVGIVPELVRHGDNGLIVERSTEAFVEAFRWCRANLDYVRAAGKRNAREMLASRTWAQTSAKWGDAFDRAIHGQEARRTA